MAASGRAHRRWDHEPLNLLLSELSGNPVLNLFVDVVTRLGNRYAYSAPRLDLALLQLAAERSHAQRHDLMKPLSAETPSARIRR